MVQQKILPLAWPAQYEAERFIVAECNRAAYDAVTSVPHWKHPVAVLIGPESGGKTHLAKIFVTKNEATSIETMTDLEEALHDHDKALVIDDVEIFLNDDRHEQEMLFHLCNHVMATKTPLLITASTEIDNWASLPDLRSRLQVATQLRITNPDEDMISGTYQKLFMDRGVQVDETALQYIVMRSERSFAKIRDIVEKLDEASLSQGRRLTRPFVAQILEQLSD